MKAQLRTIDDHGDTYEALVFWCPGCEAPPDPNDGHRSGGLHMLPVNTTLKSPSWDWDGNLEAPTLSPSILTRAKYYTGPDTPKREFVCHSFLRAGVFEFLGDCTHQYVGQHVQIPDLPEWAAQ